MGVCRRLDKWLVPGLGSTALSAPVQLAGTSLLFSSLCWVWGVCCSSLQLLSQQEDSCWGLPSPSITLGCVTSPRCYSTAVLVSDIHLIKKPWSRVKLGLTLQNIWREWENSTAKQVVTSALFSTPGNSVQALRAKLAIRILSYSCICWMGKCSASILLWFESVSKRKIWSKGDPRPP